MASVIEEAVIVTDVCGLVPFTIKQGRTIRAVGYSGGITHIVEGPVTDKMFAYNDDEGTLTQINFNPFTGEPAKVKIDE